MARSLIVIGLLVVLVSGAFARWDSRKMKPNPDEPLCPFCNPPGAKKN